MFVAGKLVGANVEFGWVLFGSTNGACACGCTCPFAFTVDPPFAVAPPFTMVVPPRELELTVVLPEPEAVPPDPGIPNAAPLPPLGFPAAVDPDPLPLVEAPPPPPPPPVAAPCAQLIDAQQM